jgi:hypothetical protein
MEKNTTDSLCAGTAGAPATSRSPVLTRWKKKCDTMTERDDYDVVFSMQSLPFSMRSVLRLYNQTRQPVRDSESQ